MKKISLMRHADAPSIPGKSDFERGLSVNGKQQARDAANFLNINYKPDLLITSDAPRVLETSKFIEEIFPTIKIAREHQIYAGNYHDIITILELFIESHNHLLLIGHNPTIFSAALEIADKNQEKYNDLVFSEMSPAKIITFDFSSHQTYLPLINKAIIASIFSAN